MTLWKHFIWVAVGGAIGSILRYGTALLFKEWQWERLPFATLTVNLLGCLLIGFLYGLLNELPQFPQKYMLLLATGFCGGFTTFSSFAFENMELLETQSLEYSLFYIFLSVAGGLLCVIAGAWVSRQVI